MADACFKVDVTPEMVWASLHRDKYLLEMACMLAGSVDYVNDFIAEEFVDLWEMSTEQVWSWCLEHQIQRRIDEHANG